MVGPVHICAVVAEYMMRPCPPSLMAKFYTDLMKLYFRLSRHVFYSATAAAGALERPPIHHTIVPRRIAPQIGGSVIILQAILSGIATAERYIDGRGQ